MVTTPNTLGDPGKPVSPRQALLDGLIGLVQGFVMREFPPLADRLGAGLADPNDNSGDSRAVHQRYKAGNLLRRDIPGFLRIVSSKLELALRSEFAVLESGVKAKAKVPSLSDAAAMSLIPYEQMNDKLEFSVVIQPFDVQLADLLSKLCSRLAFQMGRPEILPRQNPFRPEVLLGAMQEAWHEFEPDAPSFKLLLPLMRPEMFPELVALLEAITAGLARKVAKPAPTQAGAATGKVDQHAAALRSAERAQAMLTDKLRGYLAAVRAEDGANGTPAGVAAPHGPGAHGDNHGGAHSAPGGLEAHEAIWRPSGPGAPAPQQPLMSYLSQLQAMPGFNAPDGDWGNVSEAIAIGFGGLEQGPPIEGLRHSQVYLPMIKGHAPKGALTRADEHIIDLLTAVFETVFRDQSIAAEIRELMGFLQIPILKAALADQDFFYEDSHPARKLIEMLSRTGWQQRSPDDPLVKTVQRNVQRIGREADRGVAVFTDAIDELQLSLQAEENSVVEAISAPIAQALKQEKMAEAGRAARKAVTQRIASGEAPPLLQAFLQQRWVPVMTIAYAAEERKPGAVNNASTAMDELIWSVKPKLTPDDRKLFIRKLPLLLTAINKWLDLTHWQDATRLQFFAELAECHAAIVRAPLEMAPERQQEIALQVEKQTAERRLELASQTVPDAEPVADEAVLTVETLSRGMWLQFIQDDANRRKVRLAWISPQRSLFIFSSSAREEAFSVPADKLAQDVREHRVHVLQADNLVDRALSQAMEQAGNVAAANAFSPPAAASSAKMPGDVDLSLNLPFLSTQ